MGSEKKAPVPRSTTRYSSSSSDQTLPKTVRNMPPEVRTAVRRKQNNEAKKRFREKQNVSDREMRVMVKDNDVEIERLQMHVSGLEKRLEGIRSEKDKRKGQKKAVLEGKGEFFEKSSFFGEPF